MLLFLQKEKINVTLNFPFPYIPKSGALNIVVGDFSGCVERRIIEVIALVVYSRVLYSLRCVPVLSISSLFDETIFEEVSKL
jgi:hypothetical protein